MYFIVIIYRTIFFQTRQERHRMKGKLLIPVTLPATGKTYDLWVPLSMQLHEVAQLTATILESKERAFFTKNASHSFMLKETGEMLDGSLSAEELGFKNGTSIVLV